MKPGAIVGALVGAALLAAGVYQIATSGSKPVTAADLEARIMEEPVNGPYLSAFKQALPEDYAAIMPPIFAQQAENLHDPGLFDRMFLQRMQVLQQENLPHLAAAEDSVLAEFADRLADMLKVPRVCETVMGDAPTNLDPKDTEARKLSVARDIALFRGIASGRKHAVTRPEPTSESDIALSEKLKPYLSAEIQAAIDDGSFAQRSSKERCPLLSAYWQVIADLPDSESAIWAAFLVRQGA